MRIEGVGLRHDLHLFVLPAASFERSFGVQEATGRIDPDSSRLAPGGPCMGRTPSRRMNAPLSPYTHPCMERAESLSIGLMEVRRMMRGFTMVVLGLAVAGLLLGAGASTVSAGQAGKAPTGGMGERREILDALGRRVRDLHGLDVVFSAASLKVKDGWAWVFACPTSKDGANRYEPVAALLRMQGGAWKVVELPCLEEDNPDCLTAPTYLSSLKRRFPGLPAEILPRDAEKELGSVCTP